MRQRIIIVGGGVAGLTAAHELAERDFEVHLYERRSAFGGKAASVRVTDTNKPLGRKKAPAKGVPGEHGFRFYPGWYRHLPDTLARIPYRGTRQYFQGQTVADNLVAANEDLLAWYGREPIAVVAHPPRTIAETTIALSVAGRFRQLGLRSGEITYFFRKLAEFLATPEAKRLERFDSITWWQYLEADDKSEAFRDLIAATTRGMVAAKAREASAYTIANMAVRTFTDLFGTVDRVLNGPTSEVWIEPWREYLKGRGVKFHPDRELESIGFDPTSKTIKSLSFSSSLKRNIDRLRWTLRLVTWWHDAITRPPAAPPAGAPPSAGFAASLAGWAADLARTNDDLANELTTVRKIAADLGESAGGLAAKQSARVKALVAEVKLVLRGLKGVARGLKQVVADAVKRATAAGSGTVAVNDLETAVVDIKTALEPLISGGWYRAELDSTLKEATPRSVAVSLSGGDAEACLFALPVEQMAYYVNRSPMMTTYDPDLRRLVMLAEHTDWMTGIQFYLKEPVDLVPGHLVCMDSEWSLTAIEETQYWKEVDLPPGVSAIISVDIASWDRKGRFNQKEAFNCTPLEIATEAWRQLCESVNRQAKVVRLRDDMLRFGALKKGKQRSFYLDNNLIDLLDRKKQGSYEKARSVRFSADELLRRQRESGHATDTPYTWGRRLNFNAEPLLIDRVGTHALRPDVRTGIPNMFLAADYIRTNTDLACMEGANEAARRAVNAILDAVASSKPRCRIWDFAPGRDPVAGFLSTAQIGARLLGARGSASRVVGNVADGVGQFAAELLNRGRGQDA